MTGTPCTRCHRPTDNATICWDCTTTWRVDLDRMPALLADLEISTTRQARTTRGNRHHEQLEDDVAVSLERVIPARLRSKQGRITLVPHALPMELGAAQLTDDITRMLTTWIRALADITAIDPRLIGRPLIGPTCDVLCWHSTCIRLRGVPARPIDIIAWLRRAERLVRQHPDARTWIDQLNRAVRNIEHAIDSTEPEVFAGPCDAADITSLDGETIRIDLATARVCGAQLFAAAGSDTVTCRACGQQYQVAERRGYMLAGLRELWWTPTAIAGSVTSLHMPLPAKMLLHWIERDKACLDDGRAVQDADGTWRNRKTGYRLILCVGTDWQDEFGNDVLNDEGLPAGRKLYRVGDVIDVVEARALAQSAREVASA